MTSRYTLLYIRPTIKGESAGEVVEAIVDSCRNMKTTVSLKDLAACVAMGETYLVRFELNGQCIAEVRVTE